MSTQMRDEFEKFCRREFGDAFRMPQTGKRYSSTVIDLMWQAWQASRAVQVVELLDAIVLPEGASVTQALKIFRAACVDELEAAGVRVES